MPGNMCQNNQVLPRLLANLFGALGALGGRTGCVIFVIVLAPNSQKVSIVIMSMG